MKNYFILLLIIITYSCANKTNNTKLEEQPKLTKVNNQFIKFSLNNEIFSIQGKSDINSKFYTEKFPKQHTKESVKKLRLENRNIFCGRISNQTNTSMVEIFYNYPKNAKLNIEDLKKEIGIKRYTFNYDRTNSKVIDNNFRLYFFNDVKEYTSDDETEGYVIIEKINAVTDSTITAKGNFKLNIREYGKSELTKMEGDFNLEFYIGI